MKEIEVHAWCDGPHHAADETGRTEAVIERTITVNGSRPVVLDLCSFHDEQLMALMNAGAAAPLTEATSGLPVLDPETTTCPHPECGFVSVSRQALSSHLNRMHGHGIRDYPKP